MSVLLACAPETPEGFRQAAERHIAKGEFRAAQIALRNAIRLAPQSADGYRLLGVAFLKGGEAAAAEAALRKALELQAPPDQVVPLLAEAQLRLGRHLQLINEFAATRLPDPASDASLRTSLGNALFARGNPQRAMQAFDAALSSVPRYPPARLGKARLAAAAGRTDDALALIDGVLDDDPRLAEAHTLKAQVLVGRGDGAAAIASLNRAVSADPADVSAKAALASMYIRERQFDRAQALLDGAGSPTATEPVVAFLRAVVAMHKGDLTRARDEAARVRSQAPNHVPTLTLSAQIELRDGNLGRAESLLQQAIGVQPAARAPRQLLVATLLRQGRPGKALDVLQPLLSQPDAKDARLLLLAGEAYLASGDLSRASEFFERAKADSGSESASRMRLGQIALVRGQMNDSIEEFVSLASTESGISQAELLLVALHLRRQEADKALAIAETLIRKSPSNPLGHVLAGRSLLVAKDASGARQAFEAALRLQADHLPALQGLADVALLEGRPADATTRLVALLAKRPHDEALLLALAEVQQRARQAAAAEATLRQTVKNHPQSLTATTALVRLLLRKPDPAAAVTIAKDAVSRSPAQPQLLELLGNTQEAAGARVDAANTFRELTRIEPEAPLPWLKLAAAQARLNDLGGATQSLKRARATLPDNEAIATNLVTVYLADGKPTEALALAREVQSKRPGSTTGHTLEGDVHLSLRKWGAAEAAYRAALKAEPQSGAVAVALARLFAAAGRLDDEARWAKDWIAKHPSDLFMREHVAESAVRARDYRTAARLYQGIAEQAPYSATALSRYAAALAKLSDPNAFEIAERAVALSPDNPDALAARGTMLVDNGKPEQALPDLTRASQQAPDRLDIRLQYAVALLRTGRTRDAHTELNQLRAVPEDFAGKADIPALLANR